MPMKDYKELFEKIDQEADGEVYLRYVQVFSPSEGCIMFGLKGWLRSLYALSLCFN